MFDFSDMSIILIHEIKEQKYFKLKIVLIQSYEKGPEKKHCTLYSKLFLRFAFLKKGCKYWSPKNLPIVTLPETKGSCKLRVDAGGEDWRQWKNLLKIRFAKETTFLLFSMSDFPQFIMN